MRYTICTFLLSIAFCRLLSAQESNNSVDENFKNIKKVSIEVCWLGKGFAHVRIDGAQHVLNSGTCTILQVQRGIPHKLLVEHEGKKYTAGQEVRADSSGSVLTLRLDAQKEKQILAFQHFPTGKARQSYDANRAALRDSVAQRIVANMVFVAGSTFSMGCMESTDPLCASWEKPAHPVTLRSFYLNKFEVTQAEWEAVMHDRPAYWSDCPQCPVEQVSWEDAQGFIRELNRAGKGHFRLPTEAEWEFAARGGAADEKWIYAGSNDISSVGWFGGRAGNSGNRTQPVGQKQPNRLGLYDMSGNVQEWCSDWWLHSYYNQRVSNNPVGPAEGVNRVLRGGDFSYYAVICRVTSRYGDDPNRRFRRYGFRLAMDIAH